MGELLWAALIAVLLCLTATTWLFPWYVLVETGYQLMLWSSALGIPVELIYFGLLWHALRETGSPPQGWYWRSFVHHTLLGPHQRIRVLPWFYIGAAAFAAISLGIIIVLLGFIAAGHAD